MTAFLPDATRTATPRPWHVEAGHPHYIRSADGEQVARCIGPSGPDRAPEIAAMIVRAVNAHDELVALLSTALEYLPPPQDARDPQEHALTVNARALLARIKADSADLP